MNCLRKCNASFFIQLKLVKPCPNILQIAFLKDWVYPNNFENIILPEKIQRKLPMLDKVPQSLISIRTPKSMKRFIDIRGPELVHNKLVYNQFGIISLSGTQLRHGHLEMIRNTINKGMDSTRMFAVWRIDAPWKPRTKKGQGKRMGGGKGAIDHYVTPIKAGRIILEMGGKAEFAEIAPILEQVVYKLPCDSMVVSKEIMEKLEKEEERLINSNINPFSFEYVVRNKMQGCQKWIKHYDNIWFDKYI